MDDDIQDLLGIKYRPGKGVLDGDEEFLLANFAGAETVSGVGFNDAVEHQSQINILAQVVVERFLAFRIDTRINGLTLANLFSQSLDALQQLFVLHLLLLVLFQQAVDALGDNYQRHLQVSPAYQ